MKKQLVTILTAGFLLLIISCNKESGDNVENPTVIIIELPESINLVSIPAGVFTMGGTTVQNDAPKVTVTLSAYQISEKEITNQEYIEFLNYAYAFGWIEVVEEQLADPCGQYTEKVVKGIGNAPYAGQIYLQMGETGGCTSDGHAEHINNKSWITYNSSNNTFELLDNTKANWPVNWIRWYGADSFAQFYELDLPTEAQWEYAAKGGQMLDYPTDDGTLSISKANYNGDVPGIYNPDGHSVEVGSYNPNPFGLYDMGGNVWEWCQDYYTESFYTDGAVDPVNNTPGIDNKRVRRGGSWNYHSATLLTYARASDKENRGNNHFGFRVVSNN